MWPDQRFYLVNRSLLMQERGGSAIPSAGQAHGGTASFGHLLNPSEIRQVQEMRQDDEPVIVSGWGHRSAQQWTLDAATGARHPPVTLWMGTAVGCWQPPIALTLMKEQQP